MRMRVIQDANQNATLQRSIDTLWGKLPDRGLIDVNKNTLHDFTVCNVPLGTKEFAEEYHDQCKTKIVKSSEKASALLDPVRWPHRVMPSRQMLWVLNLVCFQFNGNYCLWHVRPDYTENVSRGINNGVINLLQMCTGIWHQHCFVEQDCQGENWVANPHPMQETVNIGAMDGQYLGAFVQMRILTLMDRTRLSAQSRETEHPSHHQPFWRTFL